MQQHSRSIVANSYAKSFLAGSAGALLCLGGWAAAGRDSAPSTKLTEPTVAPAIAQQGNNLALDFEQVAIDVEPSVVSIRSTKRVLQQELDPLLRFFGPQLGQPETPERRGGLLQQGQGSGLVISEDGFVVTNNHVIDGAEEVEVALWNGERHLAEVVGTDERTDLAVLKIEAKGLMPAKLGEAKSLRVGQWVAAMGNPFGLSSTMTVGVISALDRDRVGLADYENFIQTDAAINPGNSGGPLVNRFGQVVGINTAIFSRTGGSMGIGFAIPMDLVGHVMSNLIESGRVDRGFLGVLIQDLDENLARSFGYQGEGGALISQVTPGGPASKAGLEPGDIIVAIDGTRIESVTQLRMSVARIKPGSEVNVEIVRNGEARTVPVNIGSLDEGETSVRVGGGQTGGLGLELSDLDAATRSRLEIDARAGAVVTEIEPFSDAARSGLRRGDVIVELQGRPITGVDDFERAIARADLTQGVRLTVERSEGRRFLFLESRR